MRKYILARGDGHKLLYEDKLLEINRRAEHMIEQQGADKVINAAVGTFYDDNGQMAVISSVGKVLKTLEVEEYTKYTPVSGTMSFKKAVIQMAFGEFCPSGFIQVVATPGGTGALRNVVSNYTDIGDCILTSDWHWTPYDNIAGELGRKIDVFELFEDNKRFNIRSFERKVSELINVQESLAIILNTPANNPTGYSLSLEDWDKVVHTINKAAGCGKAIALVIDAAYMDYAGKAHEVRRFFEKLDNFPENVITIISYSLSKSFTMYGARCGAMIGVAGTEEIADEFRIVCEYSSRGSWSSSIRSSQAVLSKICEDTVLNRTVTEERDVLRKKLEARGIAFMKESEKAKLEIIPFKAGFFVSVPCDDPDLVSIKLEHLGVFVVPFEKGIRVSIAAISEDNCRKLPYLIKQAVMDVEKDKITASPK